MATPNPFSRQSRELPAFLRQLASEVGVLGLKHFKDSFRNQGFTDERVQKWQKRKPMLTKKKGVYVSMPVDQGRAVLTKSGRLRRSLQKRVQGLTITFTTDVEYAEVHNEGGVIRTRSGKTFFKIPQRRFMGHSAELNRKVQEHIDAKAETFLNP